MFIYLVAIFGSALAEEYRYYSIRGDYHVTLPDTSFTGTLEASYNKILDGTQALLVTSSAEETVTQFSNCTSFDPWFYVDRRDATSTWCQSYPQPILCGGLGSVVDFNSNTTQPCGTKLGSGHWFNWTGTQEENWCIGGTRNFPRFYRFEQGIKQQGIWGSTIITEASYKPNTQDLITFECSVASGPALSARRAHYLLPVNLRPLA